MAGPEGDGMKRFFLLTLVFGAVVEFWAMISPAAAQDLPSAYQNVLKSLDRKGDFAAGVFKVNIPRNDLKITVAGVPLPTPFGFGGWVAMTKGDGGMEVLMGDLVLLQEEVNPVMSALLDNGIEVTALHNHFFWDEPRVFYMHVHAHGKAAELAAHLKPALDVIGHIATATPASGSAASAATAGGAGSSAPTALNSSRIAEIVGHAGEQLGAVYKITIGREDIDLREHGARINARMGLSTWAAFAGSDEKAYVAGDVAMLEAEVPAVLRALRKNGLEVVAIHHHMIGSHPVVIFLHYWGQGAAAKLAAGFRAALDQLGKAPRAAATVD
jgi:hypothetical protein